MGYLLLHNYFIFVRHYCDTLQWMSNNLFKARWSWITHNLH